MQILVLHLLLPIFLGGIASHYFKQAFCHFIPMKQKWYYHLLMLVASFFIVNMIIFIGDLYNLIPTLALFFICAFFCLVWNPLRNITFCFIFISVAISFNALYDNFFIYIFGKRKIPIARPCIEILFWLCFFYIIKKWIPKQQYELSSSLWKLLIALTILPFGIVLSIVLLSSSDDSSVKGADLTYCILLLLSLFSFIALLSTIIILTKQQEMEQQNALMKLNQTYYEGMEQQHFEVRRLKHDLANHLQVLLALSETQKNDYLYQLLQSNAFSVTISYCNDQTVNAVLNAKAIVMKENTIDFHVQIHITEELPFHKIDTCALLGNLLDNAIEACQKLENSKRYIQLDLKVDKGIFVLKLINPCKEKQISPFSLPKTTKKEKKLHGYGLRSVEEIVKRYHGHMEFHAQENKFLFLLYLPLAKEEEFYDFAKRKFNCSDGTICK